MKRSDLTEAQRHALGAVVRNLFEGAVLEIVPVDGSAEKYLCFRMGGEELPELPLLDDVLEALQSGLYLSGESYQAGGPEQGKLPVARRWLGMGSLDEVLMTLESFGNLDRLLEAHQLQMGFRATQNVPRDRGVVRLDVSDFGEYARGQWNAEVSLALRKLGASQEGVKKMMADYKDQFDNLWTDTATPEFAAKSVESVAAADVGPGDDPCECYESRPGHRCRH